MCANSTTIGSVTCTPWQEITNIKITYGSNIYTYSPSEIGTSIIRLSNVKILC